MTVRFYLFKASLSGVAGIPFTVRSHEEALCVNFKDSGEEEFIMRVFGDEDFSLIDLL